MRLAVLELPASFDRQSEREGDIERLLAEGPPCDLALVGEATLTGYVSPSGDFDLSRFAEPLDGPTLARGRSLARRHRTSLGLPLVELGPDGLLYNCYALLDASGELVNRYRKRHPWYPETWATPGDEPFERIDLCGISLAVAICFDLHFLTREAAPLLSSADLLVFPSAWVDDEEPDARAELLGALERRFGLAIANPNWGPGSPSVRGQGNSRILRPGQPPIVAASARDTAVRIDAELAPRRRHDSPAST
jgi:5-aminopentanamidase